MTYPWENWDKKLLKFEFQGYIYSFPECFRENCKAVYWKREQCSDRITKATLIQCTIRKEIYVYNNLKSVFVVLGSCEFLSKGSCLRALVIPDQ